MLLSKRTISTTRFSSSSSSSTSAIEHYDSALIELVSLEPALPTNLPFYCDFPLERRAELRGDAAEEKLFDMFMQPDAALIPFVKDQCLAIPSSSPSPSNYKLVMMRPASRVIENALQPLYKSSGQYMGQQFDARMILKSLIFLGADPKSSSPFFAFDLINNGVSRDADVEQHVASNIKSLAPGSDWMTVRGLDVDPREAALAATAVGVAQWNRVARFSSSSGAALEPAAGGYSRRPVDRKGKTRSVWPRIDPAVIMLCTLGDYCLLGRKAEWPTGRYSTLAGFLEVGESLEQAVARECEEESGVKVNLGSVSYVASQPWPFPRSLMIGFLCQASASKGDPSRRGYDLIDSVEGRKAVMDVGLSPNEVERVLHPLLPSTKAQEEEMEAVGWFHRDFVQSLITRTSPPKKETDNEDDDGTTSFHMPGRHSLANLLINKWVEQGPGIESQVHDEPDREWRRVCTEIPQVSLDVGVFKYVLMRMSDGLGRSRLMVWGDIQASYHMQVYQKAAVMTKKAGMTLEPLGGGRIERSKDKIKVYGYSVAFGAAPHEISKRLIKIWHPFSDIEISYEGY